MTLVGPRPTSLVADGFEHWQRERFTVEARADRCLAGVRARDQPSLECRSRLDIVYVTLRSIALNIASRGSSASGPVFAARTCVCET